MASSVHTIQRNNVEPLRMSKSTKPTWGRQHRGVVATPPLRSVAPAGNTHSPGPLVCGSAARVFQGSNTFAMPKLKPTQRSRPDS